MKRKHNKQWQSTLVCSGKNAVPLRESIGIGDEKQLEWSIIDVMRCLIQRPASAWSYFVVDMI